MKKFRVPIGYNKMYLITPMVYEKLKTCLDKSDKQVLERVNRPFFIPQPGNLPGVFNAPQPPPPPNMPLPPRIEEEENEDPEMEQDDNPQNPYDNYEEQFPPFEDPPQQIDFNLPMEQQIDPEPDMPEPMDVQQEEVVNLPPPQEPPQPAPGGMKKLIPPAYMKKIRFADLKLKRKPKQDINIFNPTARRNLAPIELISHQNIPLIRQPSIRPTPIDLNLHRQRPLAIETQHQRPLAIDYQPRNDPVQQPELQYEIPEELAQPDPSEELPMELQRQLQPDDRPRAMTRNQANIGVQIKRLKKKNKLKIEPQRTTPSRPLALEYRPDAPPAPRIQYDHDPTLPPYNIPMEIDQPRGPRRLRNLNPSVPSIAHKRSLEGNVGGSEPKKTSTDISTRTPRPLQRNLIEVPAIEHERQGLPAIEYVRQDLPAIELERQGLPAIEHERQDIPSLTYESRPSLTYEDKTVQRQGPRQIERAVNYPLGVNIHNWPELQASIRRYNALPPPVETAPYTVEFPPDELPDRQSRKRYANAEIVPPEKIIRYVYSGKRRKLNPRTQGKKRKQTGENANPQPNLFSDKRLKLNPVREYSRFNDPRYSDTGFVPINIDLPVKRKKLYKCENCGMLLSSSYNLNRHKEREARRLNIGGEIRNPVTDDSTFVDWSLVRGIKKDNIAKQPTPQEATSTEPRRYETRSSTGARRKTNPTFPLWE